MCPGCGRCPYCGRGRRYGWWYGGEWLPQPWPARPVLPCVPLIEPGPVVGHVGSAIRQARLALAA